MIPPPPTPLAQLYTGDGVKIYAKLENRNPTGSIKYKVARKFIETARQKGDLAEGMGIIEETGPGNTGIALAMLGKGFGYPVKIVVSEGYCPEEAVDMMRVYGAGVIFVKGWQKERQGWVLDFLSKHPNYYWPQQSKNPAAVESAMELGKEILQQQPQIDYFLACTGTCATITGVGTVLKEKNPETKVIAVVPVGDLEKLNIPGLDDYRTYPAPLLDRSLIDDNFVIEDEAYIINALKALLGQRHYVGLSSAAGFHAATELAKQEKGNMLVIFPDNVNRYYSLLKRRFNLDYIFEEQFQHGIEGMNLGLTE